MTVTSDPIGAMRRRARREGWSRWIKSEADELAMRNGCWFDKRRSDHVEEFLARFCCHSKGDFAGKPLLLLDWQREDIFGPIFGWVRRNERGAIVRRVRVAYIEVPKKNGKSTIASGLGLYMLCGDNEPGAEVYSTAVDREQANIVHREAVNMVDASPVLNAALTINRSSFTITDDQTRSYYRALSGIPKSGFNAHCVIADELHEWLGTAGRDLYDAMQWAFASRTQPLFFQITNSGEDTTSVCRNQHDYTCGWRDGTIHDDSFYGVIYGADPKDDLWSEATWRKSNPSLGETITLESFAADANRARQSPSSVSRFARLRLGIWTTGDTPWINVRDWNACRSEFTPDMLAGRKCFAALDLSRTRDSTSLQLLFPPETDDEQDEAYHLLSYFWIPEEEARRQRGVVPWESWAAQSLVHLIPGGVMEFSAVEDKLAELAEQFEIVMLGFDPWNAEDCTSRIEAATGVPRISFPQSLKNFAAPTEEFERRVLNGTLRHNGHAVMTWQVGNAIVTSDSSGNKRPRKPKHEDPRKVDGVVSAVMAMGLSMISSGYGGSYYDDHDVEFG